MSFNFFSLIIYVYKNLYLVTYNYIWMCQIIFVSIDEL